MTIDIQETLLIVVGSELIPEEKDRPLAYRLKDIIDREGSTPYQRSIVVSDRWYLDNEMFHICPTLLIGGPGVNAATAYFYKEMTLVWSEQETAFFQFKSPDCFSLWGMNQAGTDRAIQYFIESGQLKDLLNRCWKR